MARALRGLVGGGVPPVARPRARRCRAQLPMRARPTPRLRHHRPRRPRDVGPLGRGAPDSRTGAGAVDAAGKGEYRPSAEPRTLTLTLSRFAVVGTRLYRLLRRVSSTAKRERVRVRV